MKVLRLLGAVAVLCMAVGVGWWARGRQVVVTDVGRATIVMRDTIRVDKPVAVREEVVRVVRVPVVVGDTCRVDSACVTDSVTLPVTQKVYRDSSYTAWVSGVEPALDSIEVYPRLTYVREVRERTKPARRWSVGVQGGVGVTPKGVLPYVGVGFSVRLF